jgi:hypothetical protein
MRFMSRTWERGKPSFSRTGVVLVWGTGVGSDLKIELPTLFLGAAIELISQKRSSRGRDPFIGSPCPVNYSPFSGDTDVCRHFDFF